MVFLVHMPKYSQIFIQAEDSISPEHVDPMVLLRLKEIASICCNGTSNPALDGTYHQHPDLEITNFMSGKVSALVGYSETLHDIKNYSKLNNITKDVVIRPNPYGFGTPTFFTDGLILSPRTSSRDAAVAFANYLTNVSTFKWMMLSEDVNVQDRIPRYLLSSNILVFREIEDSHYDQLTSFLKIGGFPLDSSADFYTTLSNHKFAEVLKKKLDDLDVCKIIV